MKVLFQGADEKLLIELLVISWGWICCWGRRRLLAKNTWWPIQELESSSHRCWRPVWFSYVSDGLQTFSTVHCVNWAHIYPLPDTLSFLFSCGFLLLPFISLLPALYLYTAAWNYSDFFIQLCTVSFFPLIFIEAEFNYYAGTSSTATST